MILRTVVTLSFPAGAVFEQNPQLLLYRCLLKAIQGMACMRSIHRCKDCPLREDCQYFWLTGHNFENYAGFLCQTDPFCKRVYQPQEELEVSFLWLGNTQSYSVLLESLIQDFHHTFAGQPFSLSQLITETLEAEEVKAKNLNFITPVVLENNENLAMEGMQAAAWYRENYGLDLSFPNTNDLKWIRKMKVRQPSAGLPVTRISNTGWIGDVSFPNDVMIDRRWSDIGLGRSNCTGGGRFEIGSGNERQ